MFFLDIFFTPTISHFQLTFIAISFPIWSTHRTEDLRADDVGAFWFFIEARVIKIKKETSLSLHAFPPFDISSSAFLIRNHKQMLFVAKNKCVLYSRTYPNRFLRLLNIEKLCTVVLTTRSIVFFFNTFSTLTNRHLQGTLIGICFSIWSTHWTVLRGTHFWTFCMEWLTYKATT